MSFFLLKPSSNSSFTENDDRFGLSSFWESDKVQIFSSRVDDSKYWAPSEVDGKYCLIIGRLAFNEEEWKRAKMLPGSGGLAAKLILDYWKNQKENFYSLLNGFGGVLIVDKNSVNFITDRLGFTPIYKSKDSLFFSSHSDILASQLKKEGAPLTLNKECISEFLSYGSSFLNDTYFNEVTLMQSGVHHKFDFDKDLNQHSREYFVPSQKDCFNSSTKEGRSKELADAIKKATELRSHDFLGDTGLMLSSGVDSRSVLFSMKNPKKVKCFTIFEQENDELRFAKEITKKTRSKHILLKREKDYYAINAREIVSVSGGRFSFIDGHYISLAHHMKLNKIGSILTGCYCDYMFKGLSQNRSSYKLFGRFIPFFKKDKFKVTSYIDSEKLSDFWQNLVEKRRKIAYGKYLRNHSDFDRNKNEFTRNFPLSRESDCSGRSILRLMYPFDWIFSDNKIIDLYLSLSVEEKLNGIIFEKAVRRLADSHKAHVRNNNYKSPIGFSVYIRIFFFLIGVLKRKLLKFFSYKKHNVESEGTWPNWSEYFINSKIIEELWNDPTDSTKKIFIEILGLDPWDKSINHWVNKNTHFFSRMLTLKIWMEDKRTIRILRKT